MIWPQQAREQKICLLPKAFRACHRSWRKMKGCVIGWSRGTERVSNGLCYLCMVLTNQQWSPSSAWSFASRADLDECELGISRCDLNSSCCHNTIGSYKCRCKVGYKQHGPNTCIGNQFFQTHISFSLIILTINVYQYHICVILMKLAGLLIYS